MSTKSAGQNSKYCLSLSVETAATYLIVRLVCVPGYLSIRCPLGAVGNLASPVVLSYMWVYVLTRKNPSAVANVIVTILHLLGILPALVPRSSPLFIMVNLTAVALAGTLFSITNFQGDVLDNSFAQPNDFNPVVANTKWSFIATATPNEFNIQHALTGSFLSYAGAPTSGSATYAQTVIDAANPMAFNLVLVSPSPETFNIIVVNSDLALTAWTAPVDRGSAITPITYEPFQGAAEQIWTLV
ncbi:hypothetical protein B0H16DRAFT_1722950 [Mycena metata]|uniref:Uncharacterized protein n=1 Tax=Mycena metata TaxID=1033252 RepID=A0AAD7NBH0_9AGAR|nr:hypothetical protein B0H16DRAFT_1722950 [Mycena metata]